jgi:hypothetical protein
VFLEADGTDDAAQVRWLVGPVLAGVADLVIGERRAAVGGGAPRAAGGARAAPPLPAPTAACPSTSASATTGWRSSCDCSSASV